MAIAIRIDLRRGGRAIGTDRGHGLRLQRAVGVAVDHGLGAAAVRTEDRNVRHRQIENAVSRRVDLRGLRQPVGTGRDDRLVEQRAIGTRVRDRLAAAAVRIEHRNIGPGPVEATGTRRVLLGQALKQKFHISLRNRIAPTDGQTESAKQSQAGETEENEQDMDKARLLLGDLAVPTSHKSSKSHKGLSLFSHKK